METNERECRVVVAGVGSPLRRDDQVGLHVARKLKRVMGDCAVECPYGVELCAHHVRMLRPKILVIVDAALGVEPGTILLLDSSRALGEAGDWLPSTHNLPPKALLEYASSLADKVYLMLIGVRDVGLGEEMSHIALEAADRAVEFLKELVKKPVEAV